MGKPVRLAATILFFQCFFWFQVLSQDFGSSLLQSSQAKYDIEAVSVLQKYIQYPSFSGNDSAAGDFFYKQCDSMGLHMRLFSNEKDKFNFAASLFPLSDSLPNVILLHHIDVVAPGNPDEWMFPPFSGLINNGNVYGRGAIDSKGLGVMQLFALKKFSELLKTHTFEKPHNITLLVVSGEEVGGENGAEFVVTKFAKELNPVVVFGEGGAAMENVLIARPNAFICGVSITEKTQLLIELTFDSNQNFGHGASPSKNYSNRVLIETLNELVRIDDEIVFTESNKMMLREIGKLEKGLLSWFYPRAHWQLFRWRSKQIIKKDKVLQSFFSNSFKITSLDNPVGSSNQLPKSAKAIIDIRLLPEINPADFLQELKTKLPENIYLTVLKQSPSAPPTELNDYYEALEKALLDQFPSAHTIPILFPATSDNSHFRKAGIPVYGIFPAKMDFDCIKGVHNVNERMPIVSLLQGISVYYKLIYSILSPNDVRSLSLGNSY